MCGNLLTRPFLLLMALLAVYGCESTPKHTNTLIFGTNTKVALDVSQDATGGVGITLGYKRQEAVWMPLLANKESSGKLVPSECEDDDCKAFKGTAGDGGGAAGKDAVDTYSVLATFSGQASGSAGAGAGAGGNDQPGAKASATLAQYFATGFAARLLASSGASVVNTAGETKTTTSVSTTNQALILAESTKIDRILVLVTNNKDGSLDKTKFESLVNKAKFVASGTKDLLLKFKSAQEIREHLSLTFSVSGQPLFDALD